VSALVVLVTIQAFGRVTHRVAISDHRHLHLEGLPARRERCAHDTVTRRVHVPLSPPCPARRLSESAITAFSHIMWPATYYALCGVGIYVASRSFGAFQRREPTFERHIT